MIGSSEGVLCVESSVLDVYAGRTTGTSWKKPCVEDECTGANIVAVRVTADRVTYSLKLHPADLRVVHQDAKHSIPTIAAVSSR